ncbi:MAG TPA: hypothetical protein VI685_14595, partial [Candidatus Angelobacter sp.]
MPSRSAREAHARILQRGRRAEGSALPKASSRQAAVSYCGSTISQDHQTECVGSTSELQVRVFKHKKGWYDGSFTARYNFDMLVYFETFS